MTRAWHALLCVPFVVACGASPDFDGLYDVASYTSDFTSCDGPGEALPLDYTRFEIRHGRFLGVTLHRVHRCDDTNACATDNESEWSMVVVEDDLSQISFEFTMSVGNSCLLSSVDQVIDTSTDGDVVLEDRRYELSIPYDPATCIPEVAAARRDEMRCASLRRLVGTPF